MVCPCLSPNHTFLSCQGSNEANIFLLRGNKTYYVVCPRTRTGRKKVSVGQKEGKVRASKLERSQSRNNDMKHLWMRFCGHHAVIMRYCSGWRASPASSPAVSPGEKEEGKEGVREGGKEGEVLLTFTVITDPHLKGVAKKYGTKV